MLYRAALLLAVALPVLAQPSINYIENNYSYIYPGSPNYGIAPGSLFIVEGTGLAPTTQSASLTAGLPMSINGVSVAVKMNGTTTHTYLYYINASGSTTQVGAVLPSTVAAGTGTLTVTNGTQSASAPITVVTTAVGLDTLSGSGTGRAIAQDGPGNLLSSTHAANPGETIVLWGTGSGPDPANDDHTYPQKQDNLTNLSMEVDIGGIPATIAYRGRSQYPGVDQINVVVPAGVAPGCYVSVVAYNGGSISNFASIPVAASGSTCTDPVPGFGLSLYSANNTYDYTGNNTFALNVVYGAEMQALNSTGALKVANLVYETDNAPPGGTLFGIPIPSTSWVPQASFWQYNPGSLYKMLQEYMVSEGSCTVFPVLPASLTGAFAGIDAGTVTLTGANGNATLSESPTGSYRSGVGSSFIGTSPTAFTYSNGAGGSGVGGFSGTFTYPSPELVWNQESMDVASRSQPLTLTWSGGVPGTAVVITGFSGADLNPQGGTKYFLCVAPASAGQFTIPVSVLSSLPPTASVDGLNSTAWIAVSNSTNPTAISVPGFNMGWVSGQIFDNTGITSDNFLFE